MKRPQLTGKPHWPLTRYEKVWGFWQFTGKGLALGGSMIAGPIAIIILFPNLITFPTSPTRGPLFLILGTAPVFGVLVICLALIGLADWWQLIHGTIPDPAPWARVVAYALNEPDPYKEQAELQARLDKAKGGST